MATVKLPSCSNVPLYNPKTMLKRSGLLFLAACSVSLCAQSPPSSKEVDAVYSDSYALYLDLHEHPELSSHEVQTAGKLAAKLRSFGYEVTENVGGTGVVAVMKNGAGPTIMLRTELDALPVEEKTGCPTRAQSMEKMRAARMFPSCMPADTICTWHR